MPPRAAPWPICWCWNSWGLDQVSAEERTLAAIENQTKAVEADTKAQLAAIDAQIKAAEADNEAQLAAIQRQIDDAGVWRDTQLTKLDEMVAAAKKQLDAALGTQEVTLSLTDAVKQFNDAIKAIDPQATPLAIDPQATPLELATVSTTVQAASASLTTTLKQPDRAANRRRGAEQRPVGSVAR